MKIAIRLSVLSLSLLSLLPAFAQQPATCCSVAGMKSATESFAAFGKENNFVMAHESPLPYEYVGDGEKISFPTTDGAQSTAWLFKATAPTKNYILVIHEWWGLNDHIKREADRLRTELGNVNVIALDLYDGKVATDPENATKYMQSATKERCEAIIKGAIMYAGKKARIGTIGWCFGGGWSNQASILAGKQGKACVMYYGMPETDPARLKLLKAPLLGIFAEKDGWISPEVVKSFGEALKAAKKESTISSYDADHAFANPSSPKFNNEAAKAAWEQTIAFFKKQLK